MDKKTIETKQKCRQWAKDLRNSLNTSLISKTICNIFKNQDFYESKNILGFYPFNSEIDISSLYKDSRKCYFLPKVQYASRSMTIHPYKYGDCLIENKWGIMEPCNEEESDIKKIDIVIIPALAVDEKGNRLGYGAGFYDRFIPGLREDCLKIVPIPQELFIKAIPCDHWDIPVDMVITQNKVYKIKQENL